MCLADVGRRTPSKFRCAFIIHLEPLDLELTNRLAVNETAGNERRGEKPATLEAARRLHRQGRR
jgi:hypothetical protein